MKRRILTLEDLLAFYENHFSSNVTFDAKEFGGPLVVSAEDIGCFEEYDSHEGLMFLKFKVCHTGINRNGSRISEEDMERAMPSLAYRPVLAYIQDDENGEADFGGHEFTVNDDESITYYESQVGSFTADKPTLEYDEKNDKTYVVAYAVIPKDYTQTANIIERKNGTKVSCELCINSMSYDSKDKILDLTDFYFNGVTLLGESIGEGMLGSRADEVESIESFSEENNSIVASIQQTDEMIKKLNDAIQEMSNNLGIDSNTKTNFAKGGDKPMKLDELLKKYNKTTDDLDFDYENMSDEELEVKFEELFSENNTEDQQEASVEDETFESQEEPKSENYTLVVNGKEYTFEVSLNNKIYALEELVNDTYAEEDSVYYCVEVYDGYVIMTDHWTNKSYKQSYSEEDETFALVGERAEVYVNYLTADEEAALDEMRDSYADLQARLNGYEEAEANAAKEEIFNSEDYDLIREEEDFINLKNNASEYTVDEVQAKCDALLLSYVKNNKKTYSLDEQKASTSKKKVNIGAKKEETYSPYGSLFANK